MDLLRRIAVDQNAAIIIVTHDEMISTASITSSGCATAGLRAGLATVSAMNLATVN